MDRGLKYFIGKRSVFSPDYRSDYLIGLIDTPISEPAGLPRRSLYARR
jgi:hypothetical protein